LAKLEYGLKDDFKGLLERREEKKERLKKKKRGSHKIKS
jgi:hypothetical protein